MASTGTGRHDRPKAARIGLRPGARDGEQLNQRRPCRVRYLQRWQELVILGEVRSLVRDPIDEGDIIAVNDLQYPQVSLESCADVDERSFRALPIVPVLLPFAFCSRTQTCCMSTGRRFS